MYTYNLFCYGHRLGVKKDLNNKLMDFDIEFLKNINGKLWEVHFPYHGGQCGDMVYSCVFGHTITHDDNNPKYINIIRTSKEDDYQSDYETFLEYFYAELDNIHKKYFEGESNEEEFTKFVEELKEFIGSNEPGFYSVEASS